MYFEESYKSDASLIITRIASNETLPAGSWAGIPEGMEGYTLVHFRNGGFALTIEGIVRVNGGGCVVYPPGVAQKYGGGKSALSYDRIQACGPGAKEVVARTAIPLNTVFYPSSWQYIGDMIGVIASERLSVEENWDYAVAAHTELLFIQIERNLKGTVYRKTSAASLSRLRQLHLHIRRHPEIRWSVEKMAREVSLSRSRFSVLYRAFSGISPMEDVISVRLDNACRLLSYSELTVCQISAKCGFDDGSYFCRLFKRRIGCTPGSYRRVRTGH